MAPQQIAQVNSIPCARPDDVRDFLKGDHPGGWAFTESVNLRECPPAGEEVGGTSGGAPEPTPSPDPDAGSEGGYGSGSN